MADISKWYVVHTYSGYENKVASNIETVVQFKYTGFFQKRGDFKIGRASCRERV